MFTKCPFTTNIKAFFSSSMCFFYLQKLDAQTIYKGLLRSGARLQRQPLDGVCKVSHVRLLSLVFHVLQGPNLKYRHKTGS